MKNAFKLVLLVAILLSLAATAALAAPCDDPMTPDDDVVKKAVLTSIGKVKQLVSYDISPEMTCNMNKKGEEVWTIGYKATVVYTDESARILGRKGETYSEKVRIYALDNYGDDWGIK